MKKYNLTKEKKHQLIIAFLLDKISNDGIQFSTSLPGDDSVLEPYFIEMLALDFVAIQRNCYVITEKGNECLTVFKDKYTEFLRVYDIYCAVDLDAGKFAFSRIFDFETDEEWFEYLNQDNWSDVRIAVCQFKKIDPIEIVFLSFLNEGRFTDDNNWQFDLISDLIWDEMLAVCETAIKLEDLLENDAIQDIIMQGSKIMMDNLKEENRRNLEALKEEQEKEEGYEEEVTVVEETYEEDVVYFEPYLYDPYYISPCWRYVYW